MSIQRKRKLHSDNIEKFIAQFIKDGDVKTASEKIGCSIGTVYAYSKRYEKTGSLVDQRIFGNNRKYGRPISGKKAPSV